MLVYNIHLGFPLCSTIGIHIGMPCAGIDVGLNLEGESLKQRWTSTMNDSYIQDVHDPLNLIILKINYNC